MTYQALARRWRPRKFSEIVGQPAIVRALTNALERKQIHHSYLFTGTRGVGKTSIARILAKCLNCETGITAQPCNECTSCKAIDEGYFPDLVEIDAASNTRVEDTRELLEQVMYAPSQGRYKVYLIDEVHMLSNHSFNALLKTLEEPPEHVKFLLATTNPEKLPVTILSRCLEFDLKPVSAHQIAQQLAHILKKDACEAESHALTIIAEQAQGSLRDALSLLDQALAYSSDNSLKTSDVTSMLGLADDKKLETLLEAIAAQNSNAALDIVKQLLANGVDFEQALTGMIHILHKVAWQQTAGLEKSTPLTDLLTPEQTQLYYQIALIGRRDLPIAPSPYLGFSMTVLRLLAFNPSDKPSQKTVTKEVVAPKPTPSKETPSKKETSWEGIVNSLNLTGASQALIKNCNKTAHDGNKIMLVLAKEHAALLNPQIQNRIEAALSNYYKTPIQLSIQLGDVNNSLAMQENKQKQEQQIAAEQHVQSHSALEALQKNLGARIMPGSIKAITEEGNFT